MSDFALEGPKWASGTITWSFGNADGQTFTNTITGQYQQIIQSALNTWSQAVNINFQQVTDSTNADIRIGWSSFGATAGQIGLTSYTYSQPGNQEYFLSNVRVQLEDPSERGVYTASNGEIRWNGTSSSIYEGALHELGHALGLSHSTDTMAVMNANVGPNNDSLGNSDIQGIQNLYQAKAFVQATDPQTSPPIATVVVSSAPTPTNTPVSASVSNPNVQNTPVIRFFDSVHGTHFYTSSQGEVDTIKQTRPDLVNEGNSFISIGSANSSSTSAPVFRFFDSVHGTQFLTSDLGERNTVISTRSDLKYEGVGFYEDTVQAAGDSAVYRFFDSNTGTHFYTSSQDEEKSIMANLPNYKYEGVSFWAPPAH